MSIAPKINIVTGGNRYNVQAGEKRLVNGEY